MWFGHVTPLMKQPRPALHFHHLALPFTSSLQKENFDFFFLPYSSTEYVCWQGQSSCTSYFQVIRSLIIAGLGKTFELSECGLELV